MGQYYIAVNISKGEWLHPHRFGDGLKLLEFGSSGDGTMLGLAVLLASGNGRGGGDLNSENKIVGSWAGDRIIIVGDYADADESLLPMDWKKKWVPYAKKNKLERPNDPPALYDYAQAALKDISEDVIVALCDDRYCRQSLRDRMYDFEFEKLRPETKTALGEKSKEDVPVSKGLRPDMVVVIPERDA